MCFLKRWQSWIFSTIFGDVEFIAGGVEGQPSMKVVVKFFDGLDDGLLDGLDMRWQFGGVGGSITIFDVDLVGTIFLDGADFWEILLEEADWCLHNLIQ